MSNGEGQDLAELAGIVDLQIDATNSRALVPFAWPITIVRRADPQGLEGHSPMEGRGAL